MLILVFLYAANLILFVIVALMESKRPIWALPWLVICGVLPILGAAAYFMLTRRRSQPAHPSSPAESAGSAAQAESAGSEQSIRFSSNTKTNMPVLATSLQKLGFRLQHAKVKVMANGVEMFDSLIHALLKAERTIDVDFYIYRNDDIGNVITYILIQKAQSGVKIRFVRDAIGSHAFPKREVGRMLAQGIACKVFHPIRFPWLRPSLNQRDHGKIVIIDGQIGFIGGANVGNEYSGQDPAKGPWRDTEMQIVSDDLAPLVECFEANWRQATPEMQEKFGLRQNTRKPVRSSRSSPLPLLRFETATEFHPDLEKGLETKMEGSNGQSKESEETLFQNTEMQTVYGNPEIRTDAMRALFFMCVTNATTSVDITTPYFAPDADLVMAMKAASLRNVRVRLLVPRNPDHKLIGLASRTYYPELLLAGVEIYLHERGILHAKTMVIDGTVSVVGATNFDLRSFHLNREVCEVMYSKEVASRLVSQFERDLQDATRMGLEDTKSGTVERIKERSARLFVPFL